MLDNGTALWDLHLPRRLSDMEVSEAAILLNEVENYGFTVMLVYCNGEKIVRSSVLKSATKTFCSSDCVISIIWYFNLTGRSYGGVKHRKRYAFLFGFCA